MPIGSILLIKSNLKLYLNLSRAIFLNFKKIFILSVYLPISQLIPVYPGAHEQVKPLTWSTHVAPCKHGLLAHSSMSV